MNFLCNERGGKVWRQVRPLDRNATNLVRVIEQLQRVSNFLPKDDPMRLFHNDWNSFYSVGNVGVIAVIDPQGMAAHCHVTFWDGKLRGREGLCHWLAKMHMEASRLQALWTVVPQGRRVLKAFVQRVGFVPYTSERGLDTFIMKRSFPNGR